MSNPDSVIYDGDYSVPTQVGAVIQEDLFETRSKLFHVTFHAFAAVYYRLKEDWSIQGPRGTRYAGCPKVAITPCRDIGGGIFEWTSTYAQVPPPRNEYEQFAHSYQFFASGGTEDAQINEFPLNVRSRIYLEYFFMADPSGIPLSHAYRLVKIGEAFQFVGTAPAEGASELLGEDQAITRWKGNIWERRSRYVPQLTLSELA